MRHPGLGVPAGGVPGDRHPRVVGRQFVRGLLGALTLGIYTILTYLWPLWDDLNQTLDDKIWNTLVVRA